MLLADMKELRDVDIAQVTVSTDGQTLWVNVSGVCVLRIHKIEKVLICDDRTPAVRKAQRML